MTRYNYVPEEQLGLISLSDSMFFLRERDASIMIIRFDIIS